MPEAAKMLKSIVKAIGDAREDIEEIRKTEGKKTTAKLGELSDLLVRLETVLKEQAEEGKRRVEEAKAEVTDKLLLEVDALASRIPELAPLQEMVGKLVDSIPSPETPESVRDKLEELEGDDRLPISAIKDLEELLKKLRVGRGGGGGGGVSGRELVKSYDLSPLLDGVTKTFALPGNWTVLSVSGTSFPYTFRRLVDYTFTPQAITFTGEITAASSLATGQTIEVLYVSA